MAPARGTAVLFPNRLRDGAPDWNTWHAACPVSPGDSARHPEKATLQFFKQFPRVGGAWEIRRPKGSADLGADVWHGQPIAAGGPRQGFEDVEAANRVLASYDRQVDLHADQAG